MTNTREERVASAMGDIMPTNLGRMTPWAKRPEEERELYRELARAAIAALEPSPDVWEAMRDGLQQIVQWADAYPVDIFPEPDLEAVKAALSEAGILNQMDRMHSSWARHLLKGIGDTARTALLPRRATATMVATACATTATFSEGSTDDQY